MLLENEPNPVRRHKHRPPLLLGPQTQLGEPRRGLGTHERKLHKRHRQTANVGVGAFATPPFKRQLRHDGLHYERAKYLRAVFRKNLGHAKKRKSGFVGDRKRRLFAEIRAASY